MKNSNGCEWVSIAELCAKDAPVRYGILQPGPDIPEGVYYVRPKEISDDKIDVSSLRRTTTEIAHQYRRSSLLPNDIILSIVGTIGKVAIVPNELSGANITQSSARIRADTARINVEFLAWCLRSPILTDQFEDFRMGTAVQRLNIDHVRRLRVPLPPLPEQRRIVGILDEAFAGIATAKANAEKNLRNARALFDGGSKSAFEELGNNNNQKLLRDVCYVDRGSSPRPIKDYFTTAADGVNWIKIGDSIEGDKYITATKQKITPKGALESVRVKEGDFLLTNSMSFGRPYILKINGCIHDGWYCLRLNEGLDADYFYHLLSSAYVREQFNRLASGSVVLNISSDLVKRAKLPIPPLAEQRKIVKRLDELRAETHRLDSLYQRKLAALDALKKSLLHQAFSGELAGKVLSAV